MTNRGRCWCAVAGNTVYLAAAAVVGEYAAQKAVAAAVKGVV